MSTNPFLNAPVRDAVTAILQCGEEILLLHRQPQLAVFAGYEAFPGGKVDTGDQEHVPTGEVFAGLDSRLLGALTRELREELALDLAALAAADEIEHIGRAGFALTPPLAPLRYAVHFYRIRLRHRPGAGRGSTRTQRSTVGHAARLVETLRRRSPAAATTDLAHATRSGAEPAAHRTAEPDTLRQRSA